MLQNCDHCRQPSTQLAKWRLVFPESERASFCLDCAASLRKWASDRGDTPEDHSRLMLIGRRLAGQIWDDGERTYWFRDPVWPRPLHLDDGLVKVKAEWRRDDPAEVAAAAPVPPKKRPPRKAA